jgi:membrane associated rhomboid family serine protease
MRPITDRLSPVIKFLVIANALLFAYYLFARQSRDFILLHLALSPNLLAGEIWQPVTSLFVHLDALNFFFNMLGLWFVGATIERQLGTRRFLTIFFLTGVVSNLVMVALAYYAGSTLVAAGCGSAVIALYVAFGVLFDRTPTRILGGLVLEARTFTAILIGFVILSDLGQKAWAALGGHVVAMVLAYLMAGGRGEDLKRLWGSARAKRVRRRYQVLEGGRGHSGKPPYLN